MHYAFVFHLFNVTIVPASCKRQSSFSAISTNLEVGLLSPQTTLCMHLETVSVSNIEWQCFCCLQIVMATFGYLYFNNYVARETLAVGGVLTSMLQLGPDQQLELFSKLANILAGDELLPEEFVNDITETIKARAHTLSSGRLCRAHL